ncbi:MAG: hypothetical protein E6R13_02200 [Spirochaetes bacterium]|nr:MAG: hypothetical protein E6R13_02200 [Spirochaetota bacterium]
MNHDIESLKAELKKKVPYVLFEEVNNISLEIKRAVENILSCKVSIETDISGNEVEAYVGFNIYEERGGNHNFIDTFNAPIVWSQNPKEN